MNMHRITCVLTGFLVLIFVTAATAAETFVVDPVHSFVQFRVSHLGIGFVSGRFPDVSGTIIADRDKPENSSVSFVVKTASVDTAVAARDEHLRSADFFDVLKFPEMKFQSRSVIPQGDTLGLVVGEFTLLGVSQPLTVEVQLVGEGKDPWGKYRAGFETSFTIRRSEFGMMKMLPGAGDEVNVSVLVEAIREEPLGGGEAAGGKEK